MTPDDAAFVNALRAVFRMPPICQDGRGHVREREKESETWMPAFRETGHVTTRGSGDHAGGSHPTQSFSEPVRRNLVWDWKHEERRAGRAV